jgi:hypothetical protein
MIPGNGPIGSTPLGGDPVAYFADNQVAAIYEFVSPLLTLTQTRVGPCMQSITMAQGESLGLTYGLGSDAVYDFMCEVAVKSISGDVVHRQELEDLNEDGTRFVGILGKDVTKDFEPGDYYLVADLWNEDTGEAREYQALLAVTAQALEQIAD